ncbi:MAG: CYTH domain-containing protein [Candidatus Hydrogenedentota bacterium]
MGVEIERKFRVQGDAWRESARAQHFVQGYLALGPPISVRVRIMGDEATLNLKQSTLDIERMEFEYGIPVVDARELLDTSIVGNTVEKNRYTIEYEGHCWEVDEFLGANEGLVVAEIELTHRDESFVNPDWLGDEVSHDPRYLNSNLAEKPFLTWKD